MRKPACLRLLQPLLDKPFFSTREARNLGVHPAVLGHYLKTKQLIRIGRGLYQGKDSEWISDFRWKDLIEEIASIRGSVVCLVSALILYDLTEELPRHHWIGVKHGSSAKSSSLRKLVHFRNIELGRTEIDVSGVLLPIFDRERTIVDAFRLLSQETAIKALRMALRKSGKEKLNLEKLEIYARQLRVNISPYLTTLLIS